MAIVECLDCGVNGSNVSTKKKEILNIHTLDMMGVAAVFSSTGFPVDFLLTHACSCRSLSQARS
jgi:hypothetical protein